MAWPSSPHDRRRRPIDGVNVSSNEVTNDAVSDGIIDEDHERVNGALCFARGQEDRELGAGTEGMGMPTSSPRCGAE